MTADSEPEYEILRSEGFSDHSSEIESNSSKQKKRRKHKKSKYSRDRDMEDNHICHQIEEQSIQTKRVKLLFGENEMKILNIPSTVESFSNESDVRIKSNLLPAHKQNNILVTNVFT